MFYVYLYQKNYEIKNVSVTPFYTFEQLFHDFVMFLVSEDISVYNDQEKESWIFEVNGERLTSEEALSVNIRDIISDDDFCIFRQCRFENQEDFDQQKKLFSLIRNRVSSFNQRLIDSLKATLSRIRENDNNVHDLLLEAVRELRHQHRQPSNPNLPLYVGMTIMPEVLFNFFQETVEMQQTDVVVTLKESYFDSIKEKNCIAGEVCIICQDEFEEETLVKELKCGHEFHIGCLKPWLTKESTHCPMCRIELCDNDSQKEYHNMQPSS